MLYWPQFYEFDVSSGRNRLNGFMLPNCTTFRDQIIKIKDDRRYKMVPLTPPK